MRIPSQDLTDPCWVSELVCRHAAGGSPSLVGAGRRSHPPVWTVRVASGGPAARPTGRRLTRGPVAAGSRGSTRRSWLRELMPSLVKTLPRWYWTVRALMNSCAPISGFDRPSRASRAIWVSCGVSSLARLGGCACAPSPRWPAARGGRARRTPPCRSRRTGRGRCAAARARRRAGPGGAATRRRGDARGRAPGRSRVRRSRSIASRYRLVGGRAVAQQRPAARLDAQAPSRCRPAGVASASRSSASLASSASPVRVALASTSSGSAQMREERSKVSSVALLGSGQRLARSGQGRCNRTAAAQCANWTPIPCPPAAACVDRGSRSARSLGLPAPGRPQAA